MDENAGAGNTTPCIHILMNTGVCVYIYIRKEYVTMNMDMNTNADSDIPMNRNIHRTMNIQIHMNMKIHDVYVCTHTYVHTFMYTHIDMYRCLHIYAYIPAAEVLVKKNQLAGQKLCIGPQSCPGVAERQCGWHAAFSQ